MKTRIFRLSILLLAVCAVSFVSCSDDDNEYMPESIVEKALMDKYPKAEGISWETKSDYQVAEFMYERNACEAWFDANGKWLMTETDLIFDQLPVAVQGALLKGAYASWHIDDIDRVECYNIETVYVIEVENGKTEIDLFYAEDGTLIKEVAESDSKPYQPVEITGAVKDFISAKYPDAKILKYDNDKNGIEVDIMHRGIKKEIVFDRAGEWVKTEWDILTGDLPGIVLQAVENSKYKDFKIEDAEINDTPQGLFYVLELEKEKQEYKIWVSETGVITKEMND